jgi:hypothetical protein
VARKRSTYEQYGDKPVETLPSSRQAFMALCLEARLKGTSYDAMALDLKSDYTSCRKAVKEALAQTVTELADEVRQVELMRLDSMLLEHWPHRGHPRHADVILKIQDRRAKFLGLDTLNNDVQDAATELREFLKNAGCQLGIAATLPAVEDTAPRMDHSEDP